MLSKRPLLLLHMLLLLFCAGTVFVVLPCHLPVLDGLDQHFQGTVHFPLSSAIDKPQQRGQFFPQKKNQKKSSEKNCETGGTRTRGSRVRTQARQPLCHAAETKNPEVTWSHKNMIPSSRRSRPHPRQLKSPR